MNWQTTADGYTCTKHGESFARGEVCQACVTDPDDGQSAASSEAIDAGLMQRAFGFRSLAKFLHRQGKEMIGERGKPDEGTALDKSAACKLIAEGTKLERLAIELEDRVSARDHDRTLIAHEREMSGLRGSH